MRRVKWSVRAEPLAPVGLFAEGSSALALASALLAAPRDTRLRAVAGHAILIALGTSDELPWVDGGVYLGAPSAAPDVRLPTYLAPNVPMRLVGRALRDRAGHAGLLAFLPNPGDGRIFALGEPGPLDRDAVARWLDAEAAG